MNDALGVLEHFEGYNYDEIVEVNDEVSIRFTDIGHLLGSASIEIWMKEDGVEKKIVFSGDIGNFNKPLIPGSDLHQRGRLRSHGVYLWRPVPSEG